MCTKIGVIIATSMSRNESLFSLSLASVLQQTQMPDCIVVVDDNTVESVSIDVKRGIESLHCATINYIKNNRTKNMSGTGAWNTGIDFLAKTIGTNSFVAILDDDDSWDRDYIQNIHQTISNNPNTDALFAFLKRSDCQEVSIFNKSDLTISNFLIGNPGVQGSNMCFKINNLLKIKGFDESLASCTDRDLMIRFLQEYGNKNISIVEKKLVNHFAGNHTVTSCFEKKKKGLDCFYLKHLKLFDTQTLEKSLLRAEKLFNYPNSQLIKKSFRENTNILVTGVCGLIGSNIARRFVSLGYSVFGLDDFSTGVFANIEDFSNCANFQFFELSVNNKCELKRLFEIHSFDYVFHFAALPRIKFSIDYPTESFNSNVTATQIIGEIAATAKVKLFIFASSSSVYGESSDDKMDESSKTRPMSPYAEQKAIAERYLQDIFTNQKTKLLILRLFNVYGFSFQTINKYSTLINKHIYDIYQSHSVTINGDGNQKRDFTYIDDVVDATVQCVEVFQPIENYQIINIGTGTNYSVNQVTDILQSFFKRKVKTTYNPNHYPEPTYTLAGNSKAHTLLKWSPKTNLESGIAAVLQKVIKGQEIIIGVAMHNNQKTIRRCLTSLLAQANLKRHLRIILANDNSTDNWQNEISDLLNDNRIKLLNINNSNVVKTRNAINCYIKDNCPNAVLIGRLDADDEYADDLVLSKIEAIFDSENPDLILAGNFLRQNGKIIKRKNFADKRLAMENYLMSRLAQMSEGLQEGELPSCNLFMKPKNTLPYPDVRSGEDHALLTYYLTNQDRYNIYFAEDVLLTIYNLDGSTTSENKGTNNYINCRKELYIKTLAACRMKKENRRQ